MSCSSKIHLQPHPAAGDMFSPFTGPHTGSVIDCRPLLQLSLLSPLPADGLSNNTVVTSASMRREGKEEEQQGELAV